MNKNVVLAARILLGLIYAIFGVVGLLQLMPPQQLQGASLAYMTGIMATGYFMPVLKITEILGGLSLLAGKYMPLALVILAPVTLHIALYHTLLATDPIGGTIMALVMLTLQVVLMLAHRDRYTELLKA
jgi:putative oxidoreductase